MKIIRKKVFLLFFFGVVLKAESLYISGHMFRTHCDFVLNESSSFNPEKVFNGAIIFVRGDYKIGTKRLETFFSEYHPKIKARYVLVAHDSHLTAPGPFAQYLDDPKLIAWFGKNMASDHPKAVGIPLGFANPQWPHGNLTIVDQCVKHYQKGAYKKNKLAYMNFDVKTFASERGLVWGMFANKKFCVIGKKKSFKPFLDDIATAKFVISPRGSGYDCHRTWEALYLGSYPIVKKSPIDKLYDGLPVVIVNDWSEVTEEFLNKKYAEFAQKKFKYDKLSFGYWFSLIQSAAQLGV